MTVIPTDEPVLVTGATGYLAGVLIRDLLHAGVEVHGTVRDIMDQAAYQHILDLPEASTKFKVFQANLLKAGSFRAAMEGCSVVFHTATPQPEKVSDAYKEVVAPAIKGTKNVFNQAKKIPSVKRIVLTSSINAMYSDAKDILETDTGILDETCWNDTASLQYQPYAYGKTEAEKDAWEKLEKQDQWDLVTICPGLMLGPGVKCHRQSHSVSLVTAFGNGTFKRGVLEMAVACVDVREVSRAHLEAAFRPEANGRYLLAYHETNYFALSQMLKAYHPDFEGGPEWPSAPSSKNLAWTLGPWLAWHRKFVARNAGFPIKVDSSRSERELEIEYRPLGETLKDMADQIIQEGLWSKAHMAEEARLAKEEKARIKQEEKEAKARRKEIRLAKEAEERENAKLERAAEKQRAKEERLAEKERIRLERLHEREARGRENGEIDQEHAADMV